MKEPVEARRYGAVLKAYSPSSCGALGGAASRDTTTLAYFLNTIGRNASESNCCSKNTANHCHTKNRLKENLYSQRNSFFIKSYITFQ